MSAHVPIFVSTISNKIRGEFKLLRYGQIKGFWGMEEATDRFDWVELQDPKSQILYVNLKSGECRREPPVDQKFKPMAPDQWWELFDMKLQRNYYYNSHTRQTVWQKPTTGDIIPLASLQDIGVLRRAGTNGPGPPGTGRRSQHRKLPTISSVLLDETRSGEHAPDFSSTCRSGQPASTTTNSSQIVDLAGQRVRDWLQETNYPNDGSKPTERIVALEVAPETKEVSAIGETGLITPDNKRDVLTSITNTTNSNTTTTNKSPGCFSDRPVRRLHRLNATPTRTDFSETNGASSLVPHPSVLDYNGTPGQHRQSSETSETSPQHPPGSHRDSRSSTDVQWAGGTPDSPVLYPVAYNNTNTNRGAFDLRPSVHSHSTGPTSRSSMIAFSSPVVPQSQLVVLDSRPSQMHVRHFPRTNPNCSRPTMMATTNSKPQQPQPHQPPVRAYLANTLNRPSNPSANNQSVLPVPNEMSRSKLTTAVTATANNHFSSMDLRATQPPPMVNSISYQSTPAAAVDTASEQEPGNPLLKHQTIVGIESESRVSGARVARRSSPPRGRTTTLSDSPHPSSSSTTSRSSHSASSSCSRTSSATALTDTNSEKSVDLGASGEDSKHTPTVVATATGARAMTSTTVPGTRQVRLPPMANYVSEEQTGNMALYPPSQLGPHGNNGLKSLVDVDLEQPPVPPPRSASTLGSNRPQHMIGVYPSVEVPPQPPPYAFTPVENQTWMPMYHHHHHQQQQHHHPHQQHQPPQLQGQTYLLPAMSPYMVYPPTGQYFVRMPGAMLSPHLADNSVLTRGLMHPASGLSRTDPMRAHVIQPNHRRPPPYFNPTLIYPERSTMYFPPGVDVLTAPSDYASPSAGVANIETTPTSMLLDTGNNMTLSSVGTAFTNSPGSLCSAGPGALSSATTTTTWASRSTGAWDGVAVDQLKFLRTDSCPDPEHGGPLVVDGASAAVVPKRSPSGGFLGPETSDCIDLLAGNAREPRRSTTTMLSARSGAELWSFVHPGHPAFPRFTTPFDWSKDLFKPDQDVVNLMSWTKSKFTKRLLASTETNLKKPVADIFKIVQSFMGDRKARLSMPDYGSIIIQRALNSVNIRDELFAQLCKQTTRNPDYKSLTNGWALLCVCLYYFPPNSNFRDPLKLYLTDRSAGAIASNTVGGGGGSDILGQYPSIQRGETSLEAAAAIASGIAPNNLTTDSNRRPTSFAAMTTMATEKRVRSVPTPNATIQSKSSADGLSASSPVDPISSAYAPMMMMGVSDRPGASHFARVAPRLFARSLNMPSRKLLEAPSIEEICHVKDFILKPCVFGSSLSEIIRIQEYRFPLLKIPWIQLFLTEELIRLNGPKTEGIFRLSADLDLLTNVRCQMEKLFEIFYVVYNCDSDANRPDDPSVDPHAQSADRFMILRAPPRGWYLPDMESDSSTTSHVPSSTAPSLPAITQLTGPFTWPIIPLPLSSPPSEFVLLTPTLHWPRSLVAMGRRGANSSQQVDAHLAAGLLKLWLRELAEPLIPNVLQPTCLLAACEAEAHESLMCNSNEKGTGEGEVDSTSSAVGEGDEKELDPIQACCRLIRRIPLYERRSLIYLICLLQYIAQPEHATISLMHPRNLATVIAPNLMRCTSTDPREMLDTIRPQTLFVRLLISHLNITEELQVLAVAEQEAELEQQTGTGLMAPTTANSNDSNTTTPSLLCRGPTGVAAVPAPISTPLWSS